MDDRKRRKPAIDHEALSAHRRGKSISVKAHEHFHHNMYNWPYSNSISVEDVKKHAIDVQREIDDLKMQKYVYELQNELKRQMEYELHKALVAESDKEQQKYHEQVISKNRRLKKNIEAIRMAQEIIQEDR